MAMFKKAMEAMAEKKGPGIEDEVDLENDTALSAAKDLISALESKDSGAVSSALKAHYEACEGTPEKKPGGLGVDEAEVD
jgi:hypothetical protein